MMLISFSIILVLGCFFCRLTNGFISPALPNKLVKAKCFATSFPELERCLFREYTSFFAPMEKRFYKSDVSFVDPLTSLLGIDAYQKNVDTLAGRTLLGSILFQDAGIVLHSIVQLEERKLQTRWTLQVTVKAIPWKPRAKFSGISIYTIDDNGIVVKQEDFWDSINLNRGNYETVSLSDGVKDFLGQLNQDQGAQMAAPELPYELLRRGKRYDVRRYPAILTAETVYDQRPEGYDRLGSYVGGSNVAEKSLPYYSPTIMRIQDVTSADNKSARVKRMTWPLGFAMPGKQAPGPEMLPEPTIPRVALENKPSLVVAVSRFELAATEPIVRGFTKQLLGDITADGMAASGEAVAGLCTVAQYDALFSLNKRRNEVWVELVDHPWLS